MNIDAKNPQKTTNKLIWIVYQKDYTPWPSGIYPHGWFNIWKSINVKHYINRMKEKNMLIFIGPKDITKKVKRQSAKWEKIFVDHISNTGLMSRIYKELLTQKGRQVNFKNGQRIWIDIYPEKIYKWPRSIWKDAQHH